MSKIKELKTSDKNNINIVEILSTILSTDKTKYIELGLKMVNDVNNFYPGFINDALDTLKSHGLNPDDFKNESPLKLWIITNMINVALHSNVTEHLKKFIEYNERKLIEENDLTKYKTLSDIVKQNSIVDVKIEKKKYEKQVHKIHENDEWVLLKPLTHESSILYGSGTKWCTSMKQEKSHFLKYIKSGILIYIINKKSGSKVAVYKPLKDLFEFGQTLTFWNEEDRQIDSLESGLPHEILLCVLNDIKQSNETNLDILSTTDFETYNKNMELISLYFSKRNEREFDQGPGLTETHVVANGVG